jgi:uncharacterized protein
MTPQERQLIDQLFDRLATLESAPRDADAARAIAQGSARAPNGIYALVQTVLLQDEALRHAHERIEALEHGETNSSQPSFLDSMRDTLFGAPTSRGSVPSVHPAEPDRPVWNAGGTGYGPATQTAAPFAAPQPQVGGSSFLGTAAAAAAGMIGGSLLLGSFRSMMGGMHQGFSDPSSLGNSLGNPDQTPWGGDASNSDLARDAGLNDIGGDSHASLLDQTNSDNDQNFASDNDDDGFDGDVGDTGDGGSDFV